MKLLKSVVNGEGILIGFLVEGKESEFGGIGSGMVTKTVTTAELVDTNFKNGQIKCVNKSIIEANNFKIKNLPMCMFKDDKYTDVNNEIVLTKRLLVGGELKGYEILIHGDVKKFKVSDIYKLTAWFKNVNYVIRFNENSVCLAGKPGHSLMNLPEIELGVEAKTSKKAKTATKAAKSVVTEEFEAPDFDVVSVYQLIKDLNGLILKLPETVYKKSKVAVKETDGAFISLGIGEVGSPYIAYGEKKLNVNSNFRKIGNVMIPIGGMPCAIPTYTVTTKHIFLNGQNYLEKFGIVVGEQEVEKLKKSLAGSLGLVEVVDDSVLSPIRSMYGDKTLRIFAIDTAKLDVIGAKKVNESHLSNEQIMKLVKLQIDLKVRAKYLNAVIKETKEALFIAGYKDPRPKYGIYAAFSDEMLENLKEAGVDVFSGLFTKTADVPDITLGDAKAGKVRDMVNAGDVAEMTKDDDLEVEFGIKGFKSSPTAKDIRAMSAKALKFMSADAVAMVKELESKSDIKVMNELAVKLLEKVQKDSSKITEKLWYYKMACFFMGAKKAFKVKDANNWSITASRSKDASVREFECTEGSCAGLTIKLKGLDLV